MNRRIALALIVVGLVVVGIGVFSSSTTLAAPPCEEHTRANLAANPELLKFNCGQTTVEAETSVEQMFEASATRYTAMAAYYADAERAKAATSARYHNLAPLYNATDVATDSTFLAANPELSLVHRYNGAEDVVGSDFWAANPELMIVSRFTAEAK